MTLEEQLHKYREQKVKEITNLQKLRNTRDKKIEETILTSKKAYQKAMEKSMEERSSSYLEFLWEQACYIKKYWWILQFILLFLFWIIMRTVGINDQIQRNMGVLASAFVILVVPELWKNKSSGSMEIEGTTMYSLRQIYGARMSIFAIVDALLLVSFLSMVSATTQVTLQEMLLHFFMPMIVNCCICARLLFSNRYGAEYIAIAMCAIWTAIWSYVIWNQVIFQMLSLPVILVLLCFALVYLIYCVQKMMRSCDKFWEVTIKWN